MSELTIVTNNHPRDILYFFELSEDERAELDWIKEESQACFRYKGNVYSFDQFTALYPTDTTRFTDWDGYMSDTFFSGILIKYPYMFPEWKDDPAYQERDTEHIIVGWYYC